MALDLALVSFVIVVIMARYVSLLSSHTQVIAPEDIVTMEEAVKRVAVTTLDAQPKGEPKHEGTATPKLAKNQHSDHCTW